MHTIAIATLTEDDLDIDLDILAAEAAQTRDATNVFDLKRFVLDENVEIGVANTGPDLVDIDDVPSRSIARCYAYRCAVHAYMRMYVDIYVHSNSFMNVYTYTYI